MTTHDIENVTHPVMVKALAKPGEAIIADLTPESAHLIHMAIGVSGEVGELMDCFEFAHFDLEQVDRTNLVEELGDIEFYVEGIAGAVGITLHRDVAIRFTLQQAMNKLSVKAGDVLDIIKKTAMYAKPLDLAALDTELLGLCIILDSIYDLVGATREEALTANMQKLLLSDKARYKVGAYTNEAAQQRKDKEDE